MEVIRNKETSWNDDDDEAGEDGTERGTRTTGPNCRTDGTRVIGMQQSNVRE
jgi:hypothetical protein